MIQGILGRKLGMTRLFDAQGVATATTLVQAGPCFVTQVKTQERDGYEAVQIGYESARKLNKPERGHLKQVPALRHLREVPTDSLEGVQVGAKIDVGMFKPGDRVDVIGVSKGHGFAGVVKRHGFAGGPKTHGQSDRWRRPGSIGSGTTPGRVLKGLRMAGHMGSERVTVQNLRVVQVDPERNLVALGGAVPGANGGLLMIRKREGA
ncbi:MAG: 50S ribosomal protein L3 [Chloroflexi bacterium]|nr:50S ribosomal protein L3 [Chloroflexota bacterium]